ncbi:hypothetical protein [Nonomuraea salmonea]|uniref:hypothetical protein n=1 Tax=Nonomuraea salmonea TaxID=46181 RepID=UPI0031E9110E
MAPASRAMSSSGRRAATWPGNSRPICTPALRSTDIWYVCSQPGSPVAPSGPYSSTVLSSTPGATGWVSR